MSLKGEEKVLLAGRLLSFPLCPSRTCICFLTELSEAVYWFSLPAGQIHKFYNFGPLPFILSRSCRSEVRVGWVLYSGSHKTEIKVLARLASYLEALGKNSLPDSFQLVGNLQFFAVVGWSPYFLVGFWQGLL